MPLFLGAPWPDRLQQRFNDVLRIPQGLAVGCVHHFFQNILLFISGECDKTDPGSVSLSPALAPRDYAELVPADKVLKACEPRFERFLRFDPNPDDAEVGDANNVLGSCEPVKGDDMQR